MERQIQHSREVAAPMPAKRSKTGAADAPSAAKGRNEDDAWKWLQSIFKALGDEDVVMGIIDKQLARMEDTHKAIEYEVQGNYEAALAIYERLTEFAADESHHWGPGASPSKLELNLWEDNRLEDMRWLLKVRLLTCGSTHLIAISVCFSSCWSSICGSIHSVAVFVFRC